MVVLDVLPWLFLVLFCVVFFVVCRWCCYTIATRGIYKRRQENPDVFSFGDELPRLTPGFQCIF
jgi:hypothetical protein